MEDALAGLPRGGHHPVSVLHNAHVLLSDRSHHCRSHLYAVDYTTGNAFTLENVCMLQIAQIVELRSGQVLYARQFYDAILLTYIH